MKHNTYRIPAQPLLALLLIGGCTRISVAPTCPDELQVGQSGPLVANEINPGAIAKYLWEVVPPEIGEIADKTKPSTTFKAIKEGEAVIRLTASDGLFQVTSECQTRVVGTVEPPPDNPGDGNTNDGKDDGRGGGVRKSLPPPPAVTP